MPLNPKSPFDYTQQLDEAYIALIKDERINTGTVKDGAELIVQTCAMTLGVSRASVWLLSEDETLLSCLSLYSLAENSFSTGIELDADTFPLYFNALTNSRVIDAQNACTDSRTKEFTSSYLEPLNIKSMLDATVRHEGKTHGVLCLEMIGNQRIWNKEEKMFAAAVADLISQQMILEQLKTSETKYKALFDGANDAVFLLKDLQIVDCNAAACTLFGGLPHKLIGKHPIELSPEFQIDGRSSEEIAKQKIEACFNGQPQTFEWQHKRLDGSLFHADVALNAIELNGENLLIGQVRDISARKLAERQAQASQRQLEYRATHDSLTGLPNREQLHSYVSKLINAADNQQKSLKIALLLFDLNRFKEVNDTLGHTTGDKVLKQIAVTLQSKIVGIGGHLFRLGGDEFVAVFNSHSYQQPFDTLASTISQYLQTPIDLDEISLEMSASIGIALYPDHGNDSHELLRCADVAMYHAKNQDGASPWYDVSNDLHSKRRLTMTVELGSAIRENQLVLYFQPRIHIATGTITGCEALVRWQHPKHGLVPPGEFLPLAEMSDLIHPLSTWVLNDAFKHIERWRALGYQVPVAINISGRNLTDSHLTDLIEELLTNSQIPPRLLEIEITESALINHPQRALQNLHRLDKLGVSMAIDDFGTGYSSLSYLKKLPIDTLKIDRSFVADMLTNESDSVIVGSTIDLAHNFSITVVAEGVENLETLNALAAMQCDQAQGYFIAKPMPAEDFEHWLAQYNLNNKA